MLHIDIARKAFQSAQGASSHTLHVALEQMQLTLENEEFVCLVGPSGCGKSTLLNIVNGLDRDYQGEVVVGGLAPGNAAVATMFQNPRLMPWLSVLENVCLVTGDTDADRQDARRLLARVGLADVETRFPNQLSGGMQRRVALARAFATKPQLLLMDEPFVSLDVPTAQRLRAKLLEVWQEYRAGVLFVTHDLTEALTLADRVVFLSSSPARAVHSLTIEEARPRSTGSVAQLHQALMQAHPDLLDGGVNTIVSEDKIER